MEYIWSNTDFPYMCLKDLKRTNAFRKAIHKVVRKGDTVMDIGAGSGILSFFAAEAGAQKIYSVEIDHLLAESLRKSVGLNGLSDVITVIEGDVLKTKLPKRMDVLISELMDTGLMDELQVPCLNSLKKCSVITSKTRLIPNKYKTFIQLVYTDNHYYGYYILSPKHEWPFYKNKDTGWVQTRTIAVSKPMEIASVDFGANNIEEKIEIVVDFTLKRKANAFRISGLITLAPDMLLGPTNALNGDKIIPIEPINGVSKVRYKISYKMGGGLGSLKYKRLK